MHNAGFGACELPHEYAALDARTSPDVADEAEARFSLPLRYALMDEPDVDACVAATLARPDFGRQALPQRQLGLGELVARGRGDVGDA